MIEISIPGFHNLQLKHLVLDYNGTLACDGKLIPGAQKVLNRLSEKLEVHVLTADTFGHARSRLEGIDCTLSILASDKQDIRKLEYVQKLDASHSACVGNGRNDRFMISEAVLGIAVIQKEGAAFETLQAADLVCDSIVNALELLENPLRLVASLRS